MNIQNFFLIFEDAGLFLYSILKAFLPLPSLEVLLVPLCLKSPQKWIWYSMIGAAGTCIGGAIGYLLAWRIGSSVLKNIAAKEDIEKGEALMERYGVIAVFIGGITPLPDFLLAYLAGFTHMPFLKFTLSDGIARLLRSLLVTYCLNRLHTIINVDRFGIWISILILVWIIYEWVKTRRKLQAQRISKK